MIAYLVNRLHSFNEVMNLTQAQIDFLILTDPRIPHIHEENNPSRFEKKEDFVNYLEAQLGVNLIANTG